MSDGPLIVQSDKTLLLEVDHPRAAAARAAIAPFAELERAPEHVHTYRVTPLGLWNARAAGHDAEQVVDALVTYSRYPLPHALLVDVADVMDRYGRLVLLKDGDRLVLETTDVPVLEEVLRSKRIKPLLGERLDERTVLVHPSERGHLKQELLKVGWPAEDRAGYVNGEAHPIALVTDDWALRPYQELLRPPPRRRRRLPLRPPPRRPPPHRPRRRPLSRLLPLPPRRPPRLPPHRHRPRHLPLLPPPPRHLPLLPRPWHRTTTSRRT